MEVEMRVIAEGLGVQTVALYFMSSMGIIPRADYAIFADPGAEKIRTYKYLQYLDNWRKEHNGIPFIHSKLKATIKEDLINGTNSTGNRFASIPAFTLDKSDKSKGMLRRQCTNEYKIAVVDSEIKRLYGLRRYGRAPKTEVWMGITLDEIERAKPDQDKKAKWKIKVYPFLNLNGTFFPQPLTRSDCIQWLLENGFEIPPKSACVFCPYQGDAQWLDLKQNEPENFNEAVKLDKAIRNSTKKGVENPIFLHQSCKPLDEVNFKEDQGDLFGNSCDGGYCGL